MAKRKVKIVAPVEPYIPKENLTIYIYLGEIRYRRLQPIPWKYNKIDYEYLKQKK